MDEILGLPAHPLLVHLPIVAVPALIIVALVYVLAPRTRRSVGWAVAALGVIAPLSTTAAWWSGHRFYDLHIEMISGAGADTSTFENLLDDHLAYGDILAVLTPALALAILTFAALDRKARKAAESQAVEPGETQDEDAAAAEAIAAPKSSQARRVVTVSLAAAVIGLSAASGWYVFQTGHSGAETVWDQH